MQMLSSLPSPSVSFLVYSLVAILRLSVTKSKSLLVKSFLHLKICGYFQISFDVDF